MSSSFHCEVYRMLHIQDCAIVFGPLLFKYKFGLRCLLFSAIVMSVEKSKVEIQKKKLFKMFLAFL